MDRITELIDDVLLLQEAAIVAMMMAERMREEARVDAEEAMEIAREMQRTASAAWDKLFSVVRGCT